MAEGNPKKKLICLRTPGAGEQELHEREIWTTSLQEIGEFMSLKEKIRTQTQREEHVKIQGEDSHL